MPTQAAPQAANQAANSDEQAANVRSPIAASGGETVRGPMAHSCRSCRAFGSDAARDSEAMQSRKIGRAQRGKRRPVSNGKSTPPASKTQSAKARSKAANRATNQAANSREQAANFGGEQPRTAANSFAAPTGRRAPEKSQIVTTPRPITAPAISPN